ncbi:Hypp1908 [Branchiostoma lanceolatum]|uniref:Hypp1908 protein n=2 Tax=Branchiostoma lanceolatum TaxID=7740 RepID=A0A8J9ZPU0_BRALA|nr:Hypp1908 [Branchiostoma lanceolatum]
MAEGNLLIPAAILFAGGTYRKYADICDTLKLKNFSESHYNDVQRTFLLPAVNDYYLNEEQLILRRFQTTPEDDVQVTLLGDGRCDSPGYCAKYCSYTLMEEETQLILNFSLVQVTETGTSQSMERHGFEKSMEFIRESGIEVECVATDRHRGIGASLKQPNNRNINHQYDVFHMAKSIEKKLSAYAKRKAYKDLGPWIKFIKNHLWWCSSTCKGDDVLLQEKWLSVIDHVANHHEFGDNQLFRKCAHPPLTADERENITWLRPGSPPHRALREVVSNKTLLRDMAHLTGFKHTGPLEVFHNMILKYVPKRQHFPNLSMRSRLQLAVLDHNNNVFREQAMTRQGDPRWSVVYPKRTSLWVARRLFEPKRYEFRQVLMQDVVGRKESGVWKCGEKVLPDPHLPSNIAPVERGDKQVVIDAYLTRYRPR